MIPRTAPCGKNLGGAWLTAVSTCEAIEYKTIREFHRTPALQQMQCGAV
jgi:hypothetical protein